MPTGMQMPKYKSHKTVWALKIKGLKQIPGKDGEKGRLEITPEDERYAPFTVPIFYMMKHAPHIGGYYVRYKDGYESFSPAEQFEEGYTRMKW